MRNVLLFILMIMTIILISVQAKKNRQTYNSLNRIGEKSYIETIDGVNMKMIYVEGGSFVLGSVKKGEGYSDEYPAVEVSVSSYYIGAFEVTQKQWQIIMKDNICIEENLPINGVSWNDALLFCEKLSELTGKNYQLPTEEQWEYAARGGIKNANRKYSGSDEIDKVSWFSTNSNKEIHSVGLKRPNELGIYDMSGNVYEWCSDTYMSYTYKSDSLKHRSVGDYKVLRGGCWSDYASSCRVNHRFYDVSSSTSSKIGFRVVCLP